MNELIAELNLLPHPEGGFYREIHRSPLQVHREDGAARAAFTVIHFLLPAGVTSRWHRVNGAEESWHHLAGSPLLLWRGAEDPAIAPPEQLELGPRHPDRPQQAPFQLIPAGWWQAARSSGAWTLVHCCVAPGFSFEDFELHQSSEDLLPQPDQYQSGV
ncbi:cupin domain-containing protein [Synechococcus sp. MW101C3]|uniref:cupin domain-containing protein n=1 Tax=Synechococcus sp. MW101C3 TaxID=210768 RepID=UPI000B97D182|nr:cupin domain-containing protein [Synechococcus sp. MW101C3]